MPSPSILYFDQAATSYPKPESVYRAADQALRHAANPGRSAHQLALQSDHTVYSAREQIAHFVGLEDPLRLIFTSNATDALNLAIHGIVRHGDHVVTTAMEHNSVLRPLTALEEQGVSHTIVPADFQGIVSVDSVKKAIRPNTRLVIANHVSNVCGAVQPIREIGELCHCQGILFLVDASQSAGIFPTRLDDLCADLIAAPGHKSLLGIQGTGILAVGPRAELRPIRQGGTGSFSSDLHQPDILPDRLESGTLNVAGIAALAAGIHWIETYGMDRIREHEQNLAEIFINGLSGLTGVQVYAPQNPLFRSGTVSITLDHMDCSQVAFLLDRKYGIAVRPGLHCAPLAHQALGTFPQGSVRFSFGIFNTLEEVEAAICAVRELSRLQS